MGFKVCISNARRSKRSSLLQNGADRLWAHTLLLFSGYRGSFPGGSKRPGRDIDSTTSVCFHGVTRSNFILYWGVLIYDMSKKFQLINPLNAELNPMCCLLALLGVHNFLHVSRIRVKSLTLRLLMSYIYIYIYGAPILDVSRSHTTTHHSR